MRMPRHLVLAVAPVLLLASCDPFELVEPRGTRPIHGRHGQTQNPNPGSNDDQRPEHDTTRPVTERYPVAERTANPNQVISPYAPFNVIDITGFNSGQLARDPSNNEIFRIP